MLVTTSDVNGISDNKYLLIYSCEGFTGLRSHLHDKLLFTTLTNFVLLASITSQLSGKAATLTSVAIVIQLHKLVIQFGFVCHETRIISLFLLLVTN